jgi:DNA-3-methyladenine glycosylase II
LNALQQSALTDESVARACAALAGMDCDLAKVWQANGPPPLWARPTGFETLIRIILEQQVSLVSADSMYRKLKENISPISTQNILQAGVGKLRKLGITRQKSSYFINVAESVEKGELDLDGLNRCDDDTSIARLTSIKGIGPWTARIYLLMAMLRPDVWPIGDIALATAVKNIRGWKIRPNQPELTEIANDWYPYRATAARLLWHDYLLGKK